MPEYASTFGSVTAITKKKAAFLAFDEKYFHPSINQPSPSLTARVVNRRGSAPACGSVIE